MSSRGLGARTQGRIIPIMTTPTGNEQLRQARLAKGLNSQAAFVEALRDVAGDAGFNVTVTARTVRRWESERTTAPHGKNARALKLLFDLQDLSELGFVQPPVKPRRRRVLPTITGATARAALPSIAVNDYELITVGYRNLYWTTSAEHLQAPATAHALFGENLLPTVNRRYQRQLAASTSVAFLLAARITFFDRQDPRTAQPLFDQALSAARLAEDNLLAAAVLGHMAFIPAFSADDSTLVEARDRIRAAHTFAARAGDVPAPVQAWLSAVEAEVETLYGNADSALELLAHAEAIYPPEEDTPDWFDWFSPTRLAGFKGSTQLAAGQIEQARVTLKKVLKELPAAADKQRAIVFTDLASAAVAAKDPEDACRYLTLAINQLRTHWYATAHQRIKTVRLALQPYDNLDVVKAVDQKLYDLPVL